MTFDQATWMVSLYWFLCPLVDHRVRNWIYLGLSLGVGMEVKYTIVGLAAGIVVAVLLSPPLRHELRTPRPWWGAAAALLVWAPNLLWQAANGFPSLTYVGNHHTDIVSGGGMLIYVIEFVVVGLFLLTPLWIAGMISLFRSPALRPMGIACAVPIVLFLFVGKSYYAGGTIPVTMAAGVMALSRVRRRRLRVWFTRGVAVATLLTLVLLAQLTLPITPADRLHATGLDSKNQVFADSVGWSGIAAQVTAIYHGLPAAEPSQTIVISRYYGVPGALNVYGNAATAPIAVSPQLSDWYWLPAGLNARDALMVDYTPSDVGWMCAAPVLVTHLTVPYHIKGLEQGAPVTFCRLTQPVEAVWGRLREVS